MVSQMACSGITDGGQPCGLHTCYAQYISSWSQVGGVQAHLEHKHRMVRPSCTQAPRVYPNAPVPTAKGGSHAFDCLSRRAGLAGEAHVLK